MKLTLVEPFKLEPEAEGIKEQAASSASSANPPVAAVAASDQGVKNEVSEDDLRRGFQRFVDYLAKQKPVRDDQKKKKSANHRARIVKHYQFMSDLAEELDLKPIRFDKYV